MTTMSLSPVEILGVNVHPLTIPHLHQQMAAYIAHDAHALVLNVNVNCLNLAMKHTWLHQYLNKADLVFCDGAGVVLGAKILGKHIPNRITYADWLWQLAAFAEERDFSLYFLGGRPGIAQKAATQLWERFPELKIVGIQHGYFNCKAGHPDNEGVITHINALKPHILVLGMGMPLQERWLMENWNSVHSNIALTGGAVFDYISGDLKRGPRWMTDNGLEWLARLHIEPGRLWRRYVVGNPLFLWRVIKQRMGWLKL